MKKSRWAAEQVVWSMPLSPESFEQILRVCERQQKQEHRLRLAHSVRPTTPKNESGRTATLARGSWVVPLDAQTPCAREAESLTGRAPELRYRRAKLLDEVLESGGVLAIEPNEAPGAKLETE